MERIYILLLVIYSLYNCVRDKSKSCIVTLLQTVLKLSTGSSVTTPRPVRDVGGERGVMLAL